MKRFLFTISDKLTSKEKLTAMEALGRILPQDTGKQVFDVDGVIQVENNEQRDQRTAAELKEVTLAEFVQKHGIKFEAHRVSERPDGLMSENGQRHFRCRITAPLFSDRMGKNGTRFVTSMKSFGLYFSQGSAHTEPPTLEEVLDCLASDASGYENAVVTTQSYQNGGGISGSTFVNWASEYGYDTDSRAAEKIYKTIKRQANQLKRVLGNEAYQELLWNTERL